MESSEYVTSDPTCSLVDFKIPNDVNIGDCILLQKNPCRITNIMVCKTGKHGCSKYHFVGYDIFTEKRYDDIIMGHQQVHVPIIAHTPMRVIYFEDDDLNSIVHLQNDVTCEIREDITISDIEIVNKIKKLQTNLSNDKEIFVIVLGAMGIEKICDCKLVNCIKK